MTASKRFAIWTGASQNAGEAKLGEPESKLDPFAAGMATATDSPIEPELLCPACRIPLAEMRTGSGVIWRCEKCDGRAVGLQLLRRTFTPESINPLWLHAIHNEGSIARPCPSCGNAMIEVALDNSSGIRIEVCRLRIRLVRRRRNTTAASAASSEDFAAAPATRSAGSYRAGKNSAAR